MVLESELQGLKLGESPAGLFSDGITEGDLVDVTKFFDECASHLQTKTIIKEPKFNLFEGTHSLEVDNRKLDSTLIKLSPEEETFDCNRLYGSDEHTQLQYVVAIVDRLVRSLVCWLNDYQTLPTTVLSCRYVEYLLVESAKVGQLAYLHTDHPLFDQVLCSAVYGVCYFAKFVQRMLKAGVIFEEEDLNFNSMGLDFLSYVNHTEVLNMLQEAARTASLCGGSQDLVPLLQLIASLVSAFNNLDKLSSDTVHLNELIEHANYLVGRTELESLEAPSGSFSMGIQKRLSNQFPPKTLIVPGRNYQGFVVMAQDLKVVLSVIEAETMMEIMQFANFFNKVTQRHVLARALFPLFLIRSNQTVLGKYSPSEFAHEHLLEFSLMCTKGDECQTDHTLLEAANVLFEWYQNTSQNTSRYRQGYNRQLLLWDSLQAQIEAVEVDFLSEDHDGDYVEVKEGERTPLLPYTSWCYTMKIRAMIEFLLKGFDLQVYKPFETFTMYWYSYYLAHQLEICLKKVFQFVEGKITYIHSLNKKVKKAKSSEKKETLKTQYRFAMDNYMEQLQVNKRFIQYMLYESSLVKSLSLAQVFQFGILTSYGLIHNKSPAKNKFTTDELLYNLRMKTFSTIGVPEMLPYDLMQSTFQEFVPDEPMFTIKLNRATECLTKELELAMSRVDTIIKCINGGDNNGLLVTATRLVKSQALDYYNRVKNSIIAFEDNAKQIRAALGTTKPKSDLNLMYNVQLECPEDGSSFFPLLVLSKPNNRAKHVSGTI